MYKPNSKRYRLLRELIIGGLDNELIVPIGTEFYPIDGRYESVEMFNKKPCLGRKLVENNPIFFEEIKEKERIEVQIFSTGFAGESVSIRTKNGKWKIPEEKSESIKQAIESILNNEQPKEVTFNIRNNEPLPKSGEYVTLEECERREEAAWYAAREKFAIDRNPLDKQYRYISFQYYKQSINKTHQ